MTEVGKVEVSILRKYRIVEVVEAVASINNLSCLLPMNCHAVATMTTRVKIKVKMEKEKVYIAVKGVAVLIRVGTL